MEDNNRNVLVTGGAGFIGSMLVEHLSREGFCVSVIDNLSFGRRENLSIPEDRLFRADILDQRAVADVVRTVAPARVFHLAAIHFIPYCNAHPYESSNINLQGTLNVCDALRGVDSVKKLFFASTAAVYADASGPIQESSPVGPMDIYGLTKLVGERLIHEFSLATGLPCIIGRLFNAYGPRETNPHLIPEILRQAQQKDRHLQLGNMTTRRDYIHTTDMVRAMSLLMEAKTKGVEIFNIGAGESFSAAEVVEYFEQSAGCRFSVSVAGDRVRKVDRALLQADITKIRAATGWKPAMRFQEGISALVNG